MNAKRPFAWWVTRAQLGIAGGVVLLVAYRLFALGGLEGIMAEGHAIRLGPVLISSWWVPPAVGLLGSIVGLVWMIRIHRSRRDPEPPPWRYRDR